MKKIIYKDKERDVVIIHKPSSNYLMLDLSEYSEEEQEYYERKFNDIHQEYLDAIQEVGLSSNYRYFNENKIEWMEE